MKRVKEIFDRIIPEYSIRPLIIALTIQMITYLGTKLVLPYLPQHDLTTAFDLTIPLIPWWVTIYFAAWFSWLITALWIIRESKWHCYRYAAAYIIGFLITLVIFLAYPCTMQQPELTGTGIFMDIMRFLYLIDEPTNLFPSVHVLVAYYSWRGLLGSKMIPQWYKYFNFIFMILTCLSILYTRQHVIADIPSAILIGELSFQLASRFRMERVFYALEGKGRKEHEK